MPYLFKVRVDFLTFRPPLITPSAYITMANDEKEAVENVTNFTASLGYDAREVIFVMPIGSNVATIWAF